MSVFNHHFPALVDRLSVWQIACGAANQNDYDQEPTALTISGIRSIADASLNYGLEVVIEEPFTGADWIAAASAILDGRGAFPCQITRRAWINRKAWESFDTSRQRKDSELRRDILKAASQVHESNYPSGTSAPEFIPLGDPAALWLAERSLQEGLITRNPATGAKIDNAETAIDEKGDTALGPIKELWARIIERLVNSGDLELWEETELGEWKTVPSILKGYTAWPYVKKTDLVIFFALLWDEVLADQLRLETADLEHKLAVFEFRRQHDRRTLGYFLDELAKRQDTGSRDSIKEQMLAAVRDGRIPAYDPLKLTQIDYFDSNRRSLRRVVLSMDEAYTDNINEWLGKQYPRLAFRFDGTRTASPGTNNADPLPIQGGTGENATAGASASRAAQSKRKSSNRCPDEFKEKMMSLLADIEERAAEQEIDFDRQKMPGTREDLFELAVNHAGISCTPKTFNQYLKNSGLCSFCSGAMRSNFYNTLYRSQQQKQ